MATKNKPVLGYRFCPECEERATVHEAAGKRAGFLYQRCGCGCAQANGAWVQTRLWYETDWLPLDQLEAGVELASKPGNAKSAQEYLQRFAGVNSVGTAAAKSEFIAAGGDPAQLGLREVEHDLGEHVQVFEHAEHAEQSRETDEASNNAASEPVSEAGEDTDSDTEAKPKKTGRIWIAGMGLLAGALMLMAGGA